MVRRSKIPISLVVNRHREQEPMLLQDLKRDTVFKEELAKYIDATRIDSRSLLEWIRQDHLYSRLGTAFKLLACNDVGRARERARRDQQLATGSDEAALYFLTRILALLP